MAIIDQFKINNSKPQNDKSPIGRFRRRLVRAIELQIELANAEVAGQPHAVTRKRWLTNKFTGAKELTQTPLRIRQMWFCDGAGTVQLRLKFGSKTLEIAPGMSAIEIGELADLPAKLGLIRDAVNAGEFDACSNVANFGRPIPKTASAGAANAKAKRKTLKAAA